MTTTRQSISLEAITSAKARLRRCGISGAMCINCRFHLWEDVSIIHDVQLGGGGGCKPCKVAMVKETKHRTEKFLSQHYQRGYSDAMFDFLFGDSISITFRGE